MGFEISVDLLTGAFKFDLQFMSIAWRCFGQLNQCNRLRQSGTHDAGQFNMVVACQLAFNRNRCNIFALGGLETTP